MDIKLKSQLSHINTFVFDVDGVFTDNSMIINENEVSRIFNVKDGYAINIALKAGYNMAIITGGRQTSIKTRMSSLGIKNIFMSVATDKKLEVFKKYLDDNNLKDIQTLYLGDDIPDYLVMKNTNALACCPADAVSEVIEICDYISPIMGGKGAVRDVIELVMKSQNKWLKFF